MRAVVDSLEAGLEEWRESWLPEVPIPSITAFQSVS